MKRFMGPTTMYRGKGAGPGTKVSFPPLPTAKVKDIGDQLERDVGQGASAGLSLPLIGALLGHTNPATTARYAHLMDDPLRQAAERIGSRLIADEGRESA